MYLSDLNPEGRANPREYENNAFQEDTNCEQGKDHSGNKASVFLEQCRRWVRYMSGLDVQKDRGMALSRLQQGKNT